MIPEYISIQVPGAMYEGFEKVQVGFGIDQATRDFSIEMTERPGQWAFPPGTPIEIRANADLLVKGYVNKYDSSGDSKTHRVTIMGRGKGQDIVDCSCVHDTGHFENQKTDQALQALDKFGVGIRAKVPIEKIPMHHIKPGETVFQFGERYLRPQGITMMGMADGSIDLTNASVAERMAGALIEGGNIQRFRVSFDDGSKFSSQFVKGQGRVGLGKNAMKVKEKSDDNTVKRYRPRITVAEGDTDPKRAKGRADHEKERAAGEAVSGEITVPGFRDAAGQIWKANALVYVHSPILMHLSRTMLIKAVRLEQDNGKGTGSQARLTLVDPQAFKGKGGGASAGGKQTDAAWNFDSSGGSAAP